MSGRGPAAPLEVVERFVARWGVSFDEMLRAFTDTIAPGARWDQRPMAVTHGQDEAVALLRRMRDRMGLATIDVDTVRAAVAGDVVHTERVDHLRRDDGTLIVSVRIAGVMVVEGGRITDWAEYFDLSSATPRPPG
ncbi:MAG: nuclear transport factor 2 family protein [Solirubrobacteraceae bacterium]|nr:nuclear transport factor 2 family protein [Solirubrobacteraceae bacterium]